MHNENKKPLCWLPNAMAENVKQAQINTAIYRILKAGLWNVPEVLVKENFDKLADPSAESLLKDFTPGAHMRHLVAVKSDHLFMIVNEEITIEQNYPREFKNFFRETLTELMGDGAQEFCSKITFKYADIGFIIKNIDFFRPLLNFKHNLSIGCGSLSGEPWQLKVDFYNKTKILDGGKSSWGYTKDGLIFMSEQPLFKLLPSAL